MPTITFAQDIVATTAEGSHSFKAGEELELNTGNPWQSVSSDSAFIVLNTYDGIYTVLPWAIRREDRVKLDIGPAIPAEIHSDDYQEEADFDALTWFQQASDEQLVDIALCGYGGDHPADELAFWMAEWGTSRDPMEDMHSVQTGRDINRVLEHEGGFEVMIDVIAAMAWIKSERPHLMVKIEGSVE